MPCFLVTLPLLKIKLFGTALSLVVVATGASLEVGAMPFFAIVMENDPGSEMRWVGVWNRESPDPLGRASEKFDSCM